jgi:glyoxylate/hydroxypyruvate reductase A
MPLLINIPNRPLDKLINKLSEFIPEQDIQVWPNVSAPEKVEFALVWKHEEGSLVGFDNLKGISSFGAGVDSILEDKMLPQVPIARIVDTDLADNMAEFVYACVQHHRIRFNQFNVQQSQQTWKPKSARRGNKVGILGFGQLGKQVAKVMLDRDFEVNAWSRSASSAHGVTSLTGERGLTTLVENADFLVCLLPLTESTENILNKDLFEKMPKDAALINVARGAHLNDQDLIEALNNDVIAFAYLDVFRQEPLPKEHEFWQHPKIQITPHISAVTNVDTAVAQVVENYQRVLQGKPLINQVNLALGY